LSRLIKGVKKGIKEGMKVIKRTKIVATIGPTSSDEKVLTQIMKEGVNVVRLNFSHGEQAEHKILIDLVRSVAEKIQKPVGILIDLAGPKIRTGEFVGGSVMLNKGAKIIVTTKKCFGDEKRMFINYPPLTKEIKKGDFILLDDGNRRLQALSVSGDEIVCRIIVGGRIKDRRGVNLPDTDLKISSITKKDEADMAFGVKEHADYFALSFVRDPKDIVKLRKMLKARGSNAGIIAKIETPQAVAHIDEIIEEADGIMVARGDLAIEVSREDVPIIQKDIIEKCNVAGKPVIVATQMLESMISSPVPTRAEVSDVANSILDGADAVMLSQETAFGEFPVEAVKMMANVARHVENHYPHRKKILEDSRLSKELRIGATADIITASAVRVAEHVKAKVIVALTESGFTARMVSRYRPTQPILALSPNHDVIQKMTLHYGCYARHIGHYENIVDSLDDIRETIISIGLAKKGDTIVIAAGLPMGQGGATNMCFVQKV
jgi:pyruvate kinase